MPGASGLRPPGGGPRGDRPSTGRRARANILQRTDRASLGCGDEPLTTPDPLDARATRSAIETLSRAGLLDRAARADALETLAGEADWWRPASLLLAALGTALVLSGVIYFFAANWSGLTRFEKLGLAAFLLVLALGLALWRGLDTLAGRLALLSATVLTGAFMAVFGQVYQTGADAWQLFATWAVLTIPWMVVSRSIAHVITWLVVLELAVGIAWMQELHPGLWQFPAGLCLTLALVNLAALVILDGLAEGGEDWARRTWARLLLLAAALAALVLPTCVLIITPTDVTKSAWVTAALVLAAIAASWWWHRSRCPDLSALAVTAMALLALVLTGIAKPLFELSEDWPAFILFGLIVSALVAGATKRLRREQLAMRRDS